MTIHGSDISYSNWNTITGQPDNYIGPRADGLVSIPEGEDGINIRKEDKKWNDNLVNVLLKFVCSKSVGN